MDLLLIVLVLNVNLLFNMFLVIFLLMDNLSLLSLNLLLLLRSVLCLFLYILLLLELLLLLLLMCNLSSFLCIWGSHILELLGLNSLRVCEVNNRGSLGLNLRTIMTKSSFEFTLVRPKIHSWLWLSQVSHQLRWHSSLCHYFLFHLQLSSFHHSFHSLVYSSDLIDISFL
jgi:hypothetical protein